MSAGPSTGSPVTTSARSGACSIGQPVVIVGDASCSPQPGGIAAYQFAGTGFLPEMDEGAFVLDYFQSRRDRARPRPTARFTSSERILVRTHWRSSVRRAGLARSLGCTRPCKTRGDIVARLLSSGPAGP